MSATFTKFNALIIDPDLPSRMRLKQATASVAQFGDVALLGTTNEALTKIATRAHFDVAFISYRVPEDDLRSFITQAKATPQGQDIAFVMVLKSQEQKNSAVAQNMLLGVDGFLFEPYSVDLLVEITNLADRIKKERAETRERAAITLLVSDMMSQLDLVAFLRSQDLEVTRSAQKLKEMAERIRALPESGQQQYLEVAVKLFSDAPPPKPMFQARTYSGASSRVRKMLGQKLEAEVQKQQEAERARIQSGQ